MEKVAMLPKSLMLRRYKDGKILSTQNLVPYTQDTYGGPYWYAHKSSLNFLIC